MKIYLKRLVKGIGYTTVSIVYIFHEFGTNELGASVTWRDSLEVWAGNKSEFVQGLLTFLVFVLAVLALIYLIKGVYYLTSLTTEKNPVFETSLREKFNKPYSGYDGDGDNIEKMKVYRDSKLTCMSNKVGAEEMKQSVSIDSLLSCKGKSTQSVRRYVSSELSAKSNEEGYQWLKKS